MTRINHPDDLITGRVYIWDQEEEGGLVRRRGAYTGMSTSSGHLVLNFSRNGGLVSVPYKRIDKIWEI